MLFLQVDRRIATNLAELHEEYVNIVKGIHISVVQARNAGRPSQRTSSRVSTRTTTSASPDHEGESATSRTDMKMEVLDHRDCVRTEMYI